MTERATPPRAPVGLAGLVLLLALLVGSLIAVGPAGAVIDDPDLDTAADYTYRIDPDAGEVEVTVELTVTADKPNRTTATGYYQYYFEGTVLAVPAEVGDLVVVDGSGRALSYETDDSLDDVTQLVIDFARDIYYRQSSEVVISFTLPGGAPRGNELTRINGAYASFQAWVDPRLEEATLTVIAPEGFVDRSDGSTPFQAPVLRDGERGTEQWFVAEGFDPESHWAAISLALDRELVMTELTVSGHEFDVLAWPGDQVWADFVTDNLETGLPILIDEVGLPWPLDDDLTIVESYEPYLSGYAGWYDLATDEIEIGDELDPLVMFHELTHVWFNGRLFGERWITEGLADEFGAEVVEAIGEDRPEPPEVEEGGSVTFPLNRWDVGTADAEGERWAYGASWTVTRALADQVGLDVLADAVQAAANDEIAYVGDADPEPQTGTDDWRRYLDLIENTGDGEVAELFERWVLTDRQAGLLPARADGRARYRDLEAAGTGWAPPLSVRRAMAEWRFDEAEELMGSARTILDDRNATIEVLADLSPVLPGPTEPEIGLPADLEAAYEAADDDLADAAASTARALEVATALRSTGLAVDGADGWLQRVGAIGTDHGANLTEAVDRFELGDLDEAAELADTLAVDVADLERRGRLRAAVVAAVVVLVGALVGWWWRRRRARRREAAVIDVPSVLVASSEAPVAASDASTS